MPKSAVSVVTVFGQILFDARGQAYGEGHVGLRCNTNEAIILLRQAAKRSFAHHGNAQEGRFSDLISAAPPLRAHPSRRRRHRALRHIVAEGLPSSYARAP